MVSAFGVGLVPNGRRGNAQPFGNLFDAQDDGGGGLFGGCVLFVHDCFPFHCVGHGADGRRAGGFPRKVPFQYKGRFFYSDCSGVWESKRPPECVSDGLSIGRKKARISAGGGFRRPLLERVKQFHARANHDR